MVVEAFRESQGGELDQVLVSSVVLRKHHQMVVRLPANRSELLVATMSRRHVRLHPDDRGELRLGCLFVELPARIHHPVVRHRERRHLELDRSLHEPVYRVTAIEQRAVAVDVQVNELWRYGVLGHGACDLIRWAGISGPERP